MTNIFSKLMLIGVAFSASLSIAPTNNYSVLAESTNEAVYKGDVIQVEDMVLESSTHETKVVKGKIITPTGESYQGSSFSIKEFGTYQVVYKTYFGFEEVKKVLSYTCQRRAVDLFSGTSGVDISYGEYSYNTEKTAHQGVILDMKAGSTVYFDSVIDISRLTGDSVLLDWIIDPETIGTDDFSNFTLRLSDAENSAKYVDIYFYNPGAGVCYDAGTHIRTGYEGSFLGGVDIYNGVSSLSTSTWGTPILTSFHAYPSQEPTHNGKVYFDYESQCVYASPRFTDPYATGENKTLVNNFKNVKWYKSAVWGGFPSGKVKLSITPGDFSSSSGKMVIKQILGYDLSKSNYLDDTTAPKLTIDYEDQDPTFLPKAELNKPFKIFAASAIDDFDGVTDVTTNVYYYKGGKYYDVSINNGTFTPKKDGKYVIRYYACDVSGNETETNLYIFTDTVSTLSISLPYENMSTKVYSETTVPSINDLSTSGGAGNIAYKRTLLDTNGEAVEIKDNKFTPDQIGEYILRFEAIDYNGNSSMFDVTIYSEGLTKPVFVNEPLLPPAFLNGYTYTIGKYEAYETVGNSVVDLSGLVETYVDDVLVTSSFKANLDNATLIEGKYYTKVEYKVVSPSNGQTVSLIDNIQILDTGDTKDKENYFVGSLESSTKLVQYEDDGEIKKSIEGISLLSKDNCDGYSSFARVLDTSYLNMGFELDEDADNYSKLEIKLIDSTDATNTVTFTVTPNASSPELAFPGYKGDLSISKGMFTIRYVDSSKTVFDTTNSEVSSISVNDNGEQFDGFKNGVYVRFSIIREGETGEAGIIVNSLGNQPFTVSTGVKNNDKIAPTIRFDDEVIADQNIGDNFVYPHVTAYDVLSEIKSLTGKVYYNNDDSVALVMNEDMSNTFQITKYGTYDIEYVATDMKGKSVTYYAHVSVKDTSDPVLEITKDTVSGKTFKLGSAIKLPEYKVSDNLESYILDMILICPNGERRCLLRDESGKITYFLNDDSRFDSSFVIDEESYRADMTGEFTLRLIAYDTSYNKVVKDLKYTVK